MSERSLLLQSRHRGVSLSGEAVVVVVVIMVGVMVMMMPMMMMVMMMVIVVRVIVTLSTGACCLQRRLCSERNSTCLEGRYKGVR